jgi:hypothetical protein
MKILKRIFRFEVLKTGGLLTLLVLIGLSGLVAAQEKPAPAAPAQKQKSTFTLKVKTGQVTGLSLKAKDAKLNEITTELSKRLKVPVILSPLMNKQAVSVEFTDLALEPALQLLAPQVYVDYQIGPMQQTPLGIFLSGYNEPQPALNAVIPSSSQAMLIEGDTEDGVEPTTDEAKKRLEEKPLRIIYAKNTLTIRSKSQLLSWVVLKVGDELGIPVEIRDESRELVTMDIIGLPSEEALQRLSPNIRLYVRADLQRMERTPLRLLLLAPSNASKGTSQP